jgi:lysophospholipase L1-like esterase
MVRFVTSRRWIALSVAVALVAAAGITAVVVLGSRSSAVTLPRSMASTGDSITRAFDLDRSHVLQDDPTDSWSTGSDEAVNSQFDRILAAQPAIAGNVYNDASTGATMAALDGQLATASAQGVAYVTVLMGANDLCTGTVAAMTPTATFQSQFRQALSDFFAADPHAHVFVSSIPDIFQLWEMLQTNIVAQITWAAAHICQSMLSVTATAVQRQQVVEQEQADNAALSSVCRRFAHCRFDGDAVYRANFSAADVSTVDYFHPSLSGQQMLAAVSWSASYWRSTP